MAVMNAEGRPGMMAEQFPARRRDLVDYMYMLMMILSLGFNGYFTSSVHRFMIFFAGVAVILMNQGGWFTLQERQANPAREENAELRPRESDSVSNNGGGQEEKPPNLGIVRTVAIFVTSFFTSLFPQHMPELEGI